MLPHGERLPQNEENSKESRMERKGVGPGRVRLLEEGRMWTKGKSSATGTGEQRSFVSLFLEVFQQLMLLLREVGD